MNNSHAVIIDLKILEPYRQQHERLFKILREITDFSPQSAKNISHNSYETLLIEDKSFKELNSKIRNFILKKDYEKLTAVEVSIFQNAIAFYKKDIEYLKAELSSKMFNQSVIDAYQSSQNEIIALVDLVFYKIAKQS